MKVTAGQGTSAPVPIQPTTKADVEFGASAMPSLDPLPSSKQLAQAANQGEKVSIGEEQLVKAVDRAIKALEGPTVGFEMKVHEQTKAVMVKVFNKDTGELIREIPPEKTLDLVAKMMEFAGILVDEKV